jgi:hypothetical protein
MVAVITFAEITREARPYPAYLLSGAETALALFSAGFYGHNDVVHFARRRIVTTCVDTDAERLREMAQVYPKSWDYVVEDAWKFAERSAGRVWDVVTVDPFFGRAAARVWKTLDLFLALAGRLVTVTIPLAWHKPAPAGWSQDTFPRSSDAAWLVLQRA